MAGLADILTTTQQGVIAVNNLNTQLAKMERPWTSYTPSVNAFSGSLTSTSATGRFSQIGKIVFVQMALFISSGANGVSGVYAGLPVIWGGANTYVIAGRESNLTGRMLQGITVGPSTMFIVNYDNSYPSSGNGSFLVLSGMYEAL